MASYSPLVFGGVSPEKIASALIRLTALGVPLVDKGGGDFYYKGQGFEAKAHYDSVLEQLTLTLLDKPWKYPFFLIKKEVVKKFKEEGIYELV